MSLKHISAILLLGILLFNWYGYRMVSMYLQKRADAQLEAKLDRNDYDPSKLIEIKIPMHLPYYNAHTEYERYDGEVELNGIHYKYVKRKVQNGDLYLLCLPNSKKTSLQKASDNYFKLVNDLKNNADPSSKSASNSGVFKNFMTDYWKQTNYWEIAAVDHSVNHPPLFNNYLYNCDYCNIPDQPPQVIGC